MYVIDIYTKTVISTIDNNQIMLKSIFKDQSKRDQNQPYYEGLKELIEKESNFGQEEFINKLKSK